MKVVPSLPPRLAALAAVALLGLLALPMVRQALEASMSAHMLLQYPLLALAFSQRSFAVGLTRAGVASLYWFGFYTLFVDYMNHPWFAGPEMNKCDGPCFGWVASKLAAKRTRTEVLVRLWRPN